MKDFREGGLVTGPIVSPDSDGETIVPLKDLSKFFKPITVKPKLLPTKLKVSPGVIELFNGLI
jgi:NAD kinase